jgi:hypothetical protein
MGIEKANNHLDLVAEGLEEMRAALQEGTDAIVGANDQLHTARSLLKDTVSALIDRSFADLESATNRVGAQVNPHARAVATHLAQAGLPALAEHNTHVGNTQNALADFQEVAGQFNELLGSLATLAGRVADARGNTGEAIREAETSTWLVAGALGADDFAVGLNAKVTQAITTFDAYRGEGKV